MLNILHVIPSISAYYGGPSQAVIDTVKALQLIGVNAEVATTNDNVTSYLDVPLYKQTEYEGIPVWFFPCIRSKIRLSFQMVVWLWKNIPNYNVVHIHVLFCATSIVTAFICQVKNVPYLIHPHGVLRKWALSQKSYVKNLYLDLLGRKIFLKSCGIISASSEEEEDLKIVLGDKLSSFVIPFGINIPTLIADSRQKLCNLLGINGDLPIILFMSRLHPVKGLEYLIPALGNIKNRKFCLILAGKGDATYESQIKQLLVQHNISNNVIHVGFISGSEKLLFLQGSDLFVMTSLSENFGLSVLESMSSQLPVLITDNVPLSVIVKQYQLGYVSQLDIDAITQNLLLFLDDLCEARQMGLRSRQVVLEQYRWDVIAHQLADLYTSVSKSS
jgi:glycosyltransferase involved in cell wall biosynthesis